jgi:hypothetical protein
MLHKPIAILARLRLFRRARPAHTDWDVIAWWESRRIPYNLIVGATGIASCAIVLLTAFVTENQIGDAIGLSGSPLFEILAVIIYGIMANICFTGGWILELLSRRIWKDRAEAFGEIAFTWGTLGSIVLTLIPAAVIAAVGIYKIAAR